MSEPGEDRGEDVEDPQGRLGTRRSLMELLRATRAGVAQMEGDQDSDDDSHSSDDSENGSVSGASNVDDYPAAVKQAYCSSSWRQAQHLRGRELGRCHPLAFRNGAMGGSCFVRRLERCGTLDKHEGCVNALHFNDDGSLLASGSDDLNIILWDWQRGRPWLTYNSGHHSNVFQAKFMPNSSSSLVVSAARDGQVRCGVITSAGTCQDVKRVAQHRQSAHKLALEPGNPHTFLSCGEGGNVIQVDLRETKSQRLLTAMTDDKGSLSRPLALYSIHINPTRTDEFLVTGRDAYTRIYDRRKLNEDPRKSPPVVSYCPPHLTDSPVNVTCAVYNYNGSELLATYNDEHIYLFDTSHSTGAEHIRCYKGHRNNDTVKGVNFYGAHSEFVVSGSDCGHVFLWDKNSAKVLQVVHADDIGAINCLEPHPRCSVLATSGLEHDIKIWMPTASQPTCLEGLEDVMKRNIRGRAGDRRGTVSDIESSIFRWIMRSHMMDMRQNVRRQAHEEGDTEQMSDSDSDGEGGEPRIQCQTT